MNAGRLLAAAALTLISSALVQGAWAALLTENLRTTPALPWSCLAMAGVLWLAWEYAGGRGLPERTSAARRALLRARRVDRATLGLALAAGGLSLGALAGLWIAAFQTGWMKGNSLPDFSLYPWQTVAAVIATAAVVGAVSEEAAFRGYFQSVLERRFSPRTSVLGAALLMAPGHASTQGFALPTFGFYLLVDLMLGTTTYLCDSILPGIAVHAAGLALFFALIWPFDAGRAVGAAALRDPWLWIHAAQALGFAALALLTFRRLARRRV